MENLTSYLISVAAGITVAIIARPLWLMFSGLLQLLFADLPKISGEWLAEFIEPTENGGTEKVQEIIELRQIGRFIWGEGKVSGAMKRTFKYNGRLVRQTFVGNYRKKGVKTPSGTGVFQMQVSGDDTRMTGWCLWHDRDTDVIEGSKYQWKKR